MDFLFLQLQLSLHVGERSLCQLKVLGGIRVSSIKAFVLSFFFSVEFSWGYKHRVVHLQKNNLRINTLQLPLHRFGLRVSTHELAELRVIHIQTGKEPVR